MTQTATIDQLKPGSDYPGGNINARTYPTDSVATRAESLRTFGQLQSLTVCPPPGKKGPPFYVAAGGLRLAAFQLLIAEGRLPKDHPIDITVRPDLDMGMALAASIEENRERMPLHPVNEYEQFAELLNRGKTAEDIAKMYGMTDRQVRGTLALGQLHPDIRAAWRDGQIKAETAQVFTLETDQKRQIAVFRKLAKAQQVYPNRVRSELVGDDTQDAKRFITFVGIDAYEAAGGTVKRDLFGDNHGVSDPALAKRLAEEKVAARIEELKNDGWGWVSLSSELPNGWNWSWQKITAKGKSTPDEVKRRKEIEARQKALDAADEANELDNEGYEEGERLTAETEILEQAARARGFSADQKAKSGVVLNLDYHGALEITYGVIRPKDIKQVADKDLSSTGKRKKAAAIKAGGISNALAQRLSERLTIAAANTLASQPEVAIPVLIASFAARSNHDTPPADVKMDFMVVTSGKEPKRRSLKGPFGSTFATARSQPAKLNLALAAIAADALSFKVFNAESRPLTNPSNKAILDALDGKALNAALREAFDPQDYFSGVSGTMRVDAVREACGEDAAKSAAKLRKAQQTEFAVRNVPQTGWLPPQLRTRHYDGPQASTAKPKKASAVAKLKPKAKAKAKKASKAAPKRKAA